MTSPTDIPTPPQPQPDAEGEPPELRRTLRTESGEAWQITSGEQRIGTVNVQYAPELVEGVLTLAGHAGGFRVATCGEHGKRAERGETLVYDIVGSKFALGGGTEPASRYDVVHRPSVP